MSKVILIDRKRMQLYVLMAVAIIVVGAYIGWQQSRPAASAAVATDNPRVIHLVTGEFSATGDDGQKIESYRWDPGTIFVKKGEPIELRITGVNGQAHPFVIEGLNIRGEVLKGKTTVVQFTAKQAGTYPIICETHSEPSKGGPMVGYIVVQ